MRLQPEGQRRFRMLGNFLGRGAFGGIRTGVEKRLGPSQVLQGFCALATRESVLCCLESCGPRARIRGGPRGVVVCASGTDPEKGSDQYCTRESDRHRCHDWTRKHVPCQARHAGAAEADPGNLDNLPTQLSRCAHLIGM